jgi:hypothetical protein
MPGCERLTFTLRAFDPLRKDHHWGGCKLARPMTDQDVIIEAIEEAQRILAEYETGPRDTAAGQNSAPRYRRDVVAALNGLGPDTD